MKNLCSRIPLLFLGFLLLAPTYAHASKASPIFIGLDADMSSGAALSGLSIQRGALIAIDEINAAGGVLGRPLELVTRDHRGNPARGKDNIVELAEIADLVAVIGGLHTPVAMAELEIIHEKKVIYLGAWAAGTPVVRNKYDPNYVFRVSVRDEFAAEFLLKQAQLDKHSSPCLLLENTGWGRSNKKGFDQAAKKLTLKISDTQWFNWGVKTFSAPFQQFMEKNCDVILLVANAKEGATVVKSMLGLPLKQRLPIISHWGITGGDFVALVGQEFPDLELSFLQTYSFFKPTEDKVVAKFTQKYFQKFSATSKIEDIVAPVGSAHAYDIVHLLSRAIKQAGVTERSDIRTALENLDRYDGLIRKYDPPFTKSRHDALDIADFSLARFNDAGAIVPVESDE